MQIELRPIDSIRPHDRNPRDNAGAVDAVAESIRTYGWRQPIVVDEAGVIVRRWEEFTGRKAERIKPQKTPATAGVGSSA